MFTRLARSKQELRSTSQQDPGTPHRSSTVGCQTDRTQTVSVGTLQRAETRSVGTQTVACKVSAVSVATQLSWGTLKSAHVRSKGIQATVSFKNVGTKTSTYPEFPLASTTPIKGPGLGPSKRPRLELEEEQGETSTEFEETLDSSYHPDDTVEESDVSLQTRSTHSDAKYIVFESCLGPLFEKCPVCKRDCDVQRRKMGTFVAFTQRCPNCSYFRQWESQPIIGSTPVGNLQLSAAIYFTGASFFQLQKGTQPSSGATHSCTWEATPLWTSSLFRLCLAAMHHNENADREQATTAAGQHVFEVEKDPTCSKL
ncbi:Acetyl-coenzyme A carboxylase carboxyl transferase subunit beta 2 [Dissostichus eleginoides]|uniref:Acetyl-coenzyme A carboxylase carboxyl transferase subunit beta 2 n=1 Tax=Dissostichus eleginoides TaxID=100907 RepID=A0AAD9BVA1_DISEL|nr:Acetyl-coenzyme A carboxylase carboxyl transferase subunit beta 2 [Dissostichus eleginoides]